MRLSASEAASSVLSSGHAYAMRHAASTFSPAASINERLFGITQVAKLKEIAARVEAEGWKGFVHMCMRVCVDVGVGNDNCHQLFVDVVVVVVVVVVFLL